MPFTQAPTPREHISTLQFKTMKLMLMQSKLFIQISSVSRGNLLCILWFNFKVILKGWEPEILLCGRMFS